MGGGELQMLITVRFSPSILLKLCKKKKRKEKKKEGGKKKKKEGTSNSVSKILKR